MITAKVLRTFISNGQPVPAGSIIRIPADALPSLAGLVEVIDARQVITDTIAEIDRAGRPWPLDFYASLPTAALERLTELMQAVEAAALAEDVAATAERLAAYRAELFRHVN